MSHNTEQGRRKRPRTLEDEEMQAPVPMEVDQEGVEDQGHGDDHGTEQENLDYAEQHQYDGAPEGGWNHEAAGLILPRENHVFDL
eukprot:10060070-Heterocapsa_arctica.AAC.1